MAEEPRRPVLVLLRHRRLDQSVPPELAASLALETANILRAGTLGFTALLSDAQRAAAAKHPLVTGLEDNPECLAPLRTAVQNPDAPDRYVVCTLRNVTTPADIIADLDLHTAKVEIKGMWFTATLSTDQLNDLRRMPGVDFISLTVTGYLD